MKKVIVNKEEIQTLLNLKLSNSEVAARLNIKVSLLRRRMAEWGLHSQNHMRHTEESKRKLSEKRKKFLSENPDKHPWKNQDKFKSIPCERIKTFLNSKNINFIEEFGPSLDKNYSIDIAFPERKIGLEINGNQHYNPDGSLKKYYQFRHDYIENLDWKLYEIHYSCCFNEVQIIKIINDILESPQKLEFDYTNYKPRTSTRINICSCGQKKSLSSGMCRPCRSLFNVQSGSKRNVKNRPLKNELHYLLWNIPTSSIGKIFNINGNSVLKWARKENLKSPPKGYWQRLKVGAIIDYQI